MRAHLEVVVYRVIRSKRTDSRRSNKIKERQGAVDPSKDHSCPHYDAKCAPNPLGTPFAPHKIRTRATSRYCARYFVVPILYSDALSDLIHTLQHTFERYAMHQQLTLYNQDNFGNYRVGGGVNETNHPGSNNRNTYSCIYCVEFHTQSHMVQWQKLPRVRIRPRD